MGIAWILYAHRWWGKLRQLTRKIKRSKTNKIHWIVCAASALDHHIEIIKIDPLLRWLLCVLNRIRLIRDSHWICAFRLTAFAFQLKPPTSSNSIWSNTNLAYRRKFWKQYNDSHRFASTFDHSSANGFCFSRQLNMYESETRSLTFTSIHRFTSDCVNQYASMLDAVNGSRSQQCCVGYAGWGTVWIISYAWRTDGN